MATEKTLFQPVQNECRFLKSDISGRFLGFFLRLLLEFVTHSKNVLVKGCYEVLTVSRAVFYFYLMFYDTRYALLELVFL